MPSRTQYYGPQPQEIPCNLICGRSKRHKTTPHSSSPPKSKGKQGRRTTEVAETQEMATFFLSNAKACLLSSSSPSSSILHWQQQIVCRAGNEPSSILFRRRTISLNLTATAWIFTSLVGYKGWSNEANAAILEADDDEELLEKVKRDRKKRLEKQGVISSSTEEKAYLQDLVYKLSLVGQAIEKNDLSVASSVLGSYKDSGWVQKVNSALNKLSSSDEEKTEVDTFNSSLASLISSVSRNDIEASKVAFVASASAFEKWTTLSGLVEQLKGL